MVNETYGASMKSIFEVINTLYMMTRSCFIDDDVGGKFEYRGRQQQTKSMTLAENQQQQVHDTANMSQHRTTTCAAPFVTLIWLSAERPERC
jgi:hypothetical protein